MDGCADGVTAPLVSYRVLKLVSKSEAYMAAAPRPRVTGNISRLSLSVTYCNK